MKTVDVFFTPAGRYYVFPHRLMGENTDTARQIFLINAKNLEFRWLRKIHRVMNLAHKADATPVVVLGEGCLVVKQERCAGSVVDLDSEDYLNSVIKL